MRRWFSGFDFDRDALDNLKTGFFQRHQLIGVIRHYAHFAESQIKQNFRALLVLSGVNGKSEFLVGFDRIRAVVLKRVSSDFVDNSDAASFLLLIDDCAASFGFNQLHRLLQLQTAIAFYRTEDITRQTLRMNSDKRRHIGAHLSFYQNDKFFAARQRPVCRNQKLADLRRQFRRRHFFHGDFTLLRRTSMIVFRQLLQFHKCL
jgi:hypothetical protein